MFEQLEKINTPPEPYQFYTAADLWTDEYTSEQMLKAHLDQGIEAASRNFAFIDRSVDWILSHFNVEPGKKIADFGCGPGLYTTRLAQRQADVTGIDFSKRSIQYAQDLAARGGLSIRYINENYLDFETEDRFHLITMIMCDFCALSPAQRKRILNRFHSFLEPDGFILLDVYSLTAFKEWEEQAVYQANLLNGFWSPDKYYAFLNTFKYEREKVVLDKFTVIEPGRTRTIYNWFQCFSPEEVEMEFKECGFSIEGFYSDVAGTPFSPESKEFAVVAKKQ